MKLRDETKYVIHQYDYIKVKPFLESYLSVDPNAVNGKYTVRSLYFDSIDNDDLYDNLQGNEIKKKIRLRHYPGTEKYTLEVKHKIGSRGYKESYRLSREEAEEVAKSNFDCLKSKGDKGMLLYYEMTTKIYRPKSIIVYDRDPYTFLLDNTRVTFDYNIRSTPITSSFFDQRITSLKPMLDPQLGVFEVKCDKEVFGAIQDIIKKLNIHPVANSKYTLARMIEY
jgi:hypothetical protein